MFRNLVFVGSPGLAAAGQTCRQGRRTRGAGETDALRASSAAPGLVLMVEAVIIRTFAEVLGSSGTTLRRMDEIIVVVHLRRPGRHRREGESCGSVPTGSTGP